MSGRDDDTQPGTSSLGAVAEPPELLAGRYQIVRWLGGGGMGRVYEAFDIELEERVALKMLTGTLTDEVIERFRREVRLTRRIQHPNVARMFDIGDQDGERFLTMELVDGGSLVPEVGQPMPWPRLAKLATQICAGLAAAHDKGVVHRDLKPGNVLVERETDRVVLTDFGIARSGDDAIVTQIGAIVGTPQYMAPEQLQGEPVDARADVFSLGVMLYELASGSLPWSGATPVQIAAAQATEQARPLIASSVPASFVALVESCIALDRDRRPPTARDVGDAIAAMADGDDSRTAPRAVAPAPDPTAETTIAVLPFTSDPADDYLARGVVEDLIDTLSTTPGLRVRPAGGVEGDDARAIGLKLAVDHVVVGSLRRGLRGLRVSARLIGVADGFQIWAHHLECDPTAILGASEQLCHAIATALSTRAARTTRPTDPRAVELFLRARVEMRRFWGEHAQVAADLLEQAVAISPESPPIAAGYACAIVQAWVKQNKPELLPRVHVAVDRALALGHPDAYLASSVLRTNEGDFEGGAADLAIGLVRGPMSPLANEIAGRLFVEVEHGPTGRRYYETSIGFDPGRLLLVSADLARLDALEGNWGAATARLATLLHDPDPAIRQLGAMYDSRLAVWRRDVDTMIAAIAAAGRLDGNAMLDQVRRFRAGERFDPAVWHRTISSITSKVVEGQPKRLQLVALQRTVELAMLVDQPDHAIDGLRIAASFGLIDVVWLDRCPLFAGADGDPRWRALRDEVGARAAGIVDAFHAATR